MLMLLLLLLLFVLLLLPPKILRSPTRQRNYSNRKDQIEQFVIAMIKRTCIKTPEYLTELGDHKTTKREITEKTHWFSKIILVERGFCFQSSIHSRQWEKV